MSPKLTLPSVPLPCPGFSKNSDFIALDCPQFGNKIGDSCPALPWVPQPIGDRIGDIVHPRKRRAKWQASYHAGFILLHYSLGVNQNCPHKCTAERRGFSR